MHIFWPHYFAPYFALAMGALAASVAEVTVWIAERLGAAVDRHRTGPPHPGSRWCCSGLPTAVILKDGLSLVRLARETGGRFAEANLDTDLDKEAVLRWFLRGRAPTVGIAYHGSIHDGWALQWELRPRLSVANQPSFGGVSEATRVYIFDTRADTGGRSAAGGRALPRPRGRIPVGDGSGRAPRPTRRLPARGARAVAAGERWWLGPTEPVRAVQPNAWVTWEWRTMLGQPAAVPTTAPVTTEELRIAHNAALERGDVAGAARLRAALAARFDVHPTAQFEGGTALLGGVQRTGARRSITLYFLAGELPRRRPLLGARQGGRTAPLLGAARGAREPGAGGRADLADRLSGAAARSTAWRWSTGSGRGRRCSPAAGCLGRGVWGATRRSSSRAFERPARSSSALVFAGREGVEAQLVREAVDAAGAKAGFDQQRPEILHVVVHLVVVHLGGGREAAAGRPRARGSACRARTGR